MAAILPKFREDEGSEMWKRKEEKLFPWHDGPWHTNRACPQRPERANQWGNSSQEPRGWGRGGSGQKGIFFLFFFSFCLFFSPLSSFHCPL